jgi:hypothetical protein
MKHLFWFSIHQRGSIINILKSLCKAPVILVTFYWDLNLWHIYSTIKFHKNPVSRRWVVPCGRTDRQIPKLTVAFRKFANAPKHDTNVCCAYTYQCSTDGFRIIIWTVHTNSSTWCLCTPNMCQNIYDVCKNSKYLENRIILPCPSSLPIHVK